MSERKSLIQLIGSAERELNRRRSTYSTLLDKGGMTPEQVLHELDCAEQTVETLRALANIAEELQRLLEPTGKKIG